MKSLLTKTSIFLLGMIIGASFYLAGFKAAPKALPTQGVNAGGFIPGCWDEANAQMPSGWERICGDITLMPIGGVRQKVQEDDPTWDCHTMGDMHCGKAEGITKE